MSGAPCVMRSGAEKVNVVKSMVAEAGWEVAEQFLALPSSSNNQIVISYSDTVVYIHFFCNVKAPKMI